MTNVPNVQTRAAGRTDWLSVIRTPDGLLYSALLACAAAIYVARCIQFDFLADDAFITFRYARNLSRGFGFVFNPGERVEGYTNFLLVIVLGGLNRLGADIVMAGRIASVSGGVAMVVLTGIVVRRMIPTVPWASVAAAALVAVNPFVAAWGGSGLETTIFGALLLLVMLPFVSGEITSRGFLGSSACALLLATTRPEGAALFALVVAAALLGLGRARAGRLVPGIILFAAVGGFYFLWRWQYFGSLLPNTYTAKSPFSATHIPLGLLYLGGFTANLFVLLSIPVAFDGATFAWRSTRLPVLLLGALLLIVVAEGGDGLPMYRFLVPAVPLLVVLTVLGATNPRRKSRNAKIRLFYPTIALGALVVLSFFPRRDIQYMLYSHQREYEIPRWRAAGLALARSLPRDALIAAVPIGAVGWYSDLPVLDMLGLTDAIIARRPIDPAIKWAGHQKHDGAYVIARRPAVLLLGNIFVNDSSLPPSVDLPRLTAAFFEREGDVLQQPEFAANYRLVTVPVGDGWFLHCYLRTDVAAQANLTWQAAPGQRSVS